MTSGGGSGFSRHTRSSRRHGLDAVDVLERERPGVGLFATVAQHTRGILERDADALVAVGSVLHSSSRPLLYASAAE